MTDIIDEREKTHGSFMATASKAQQLKDAMRGGKNWEELDDMQREALQMIATKIARILEGCHDEVDHWRDLSGYSQLVVRELDRLNAYIFSDSGPTLRPGEDSPGTPFPAPASCVWPDEVEQPET